MAAPGSDGRRITAGLCLIAAPVLVLVADATHLVGGYEVEATVASWIGFALFVPAVLGMAHLLRLRADGIGMAGATCAIVGAIAGASVATLGRVDAMLESTSPDPRVVFSSPALAQAQAPWSAMVETAFATHAILPATILMPRLLFGVGIVILAIGLARARALRSSGALVLALGGLLSPVGHLLNLLAVLLASDVVLVISLGALGLRVLSSHALWDLESRFA